MKRINAISYATVLVLAGMSAAVDRSPCAAAAGARSGRLPEGNDGIAAKYPGDERIEEDPRVIFVEMMLKMNDPPDDSNGEQAFWIDGKLWRTGGQVVSHVGKGFPQGRWTGGWWSPDAKSKTAFEGFRWRSTPKLAVNYLWTYLYITKSPPGHTSRVWFDNIVVAKDYVGPLRTR